MVMKPVRHDELLKIFGAWHEPIHRLIRNTPPEQILQNDIWDIAPFKTWSRGRVVLLGDAAHPTTPNLGQGAGMAIESAVVLARELSASDDVPQAIGEYERKRMPRTARITKESWRIGKIGQLENPSACAVRDFVLRAVPASIIERRIANLVAAAR